MTTSFDAYVHQLLEPDTITYGNYKRHAPVRNVMSNVIKWNEYKAAFIKQHGIEAWEKLNKSNSHDNTEG